MKYGKLMKIQKRARVYGGISTAAILIGLILCISAIIVLSSSGQSHAFYGIAIATGFVLVVVSIVFTRLAARQHGFTDDYFAVKVMDIITEHGIESGKFELVQVSPYSYIVAFHNQVVDYDVLQAAIDKEVTQMNRIMKYSITVKLI